ncbi:hypothetical protein L598_002600000180 [Mesorhizobium sp. J18]|uniref:SRPBCC domain-containing protein n=1 Tax=Mesorhizobium sp. J18 TaxID=935263 RepID=UPI00119B7C90|nr:SRPBCC domain-containing protein [Mesorhizobium sp. J18]TWG96388.1 hypothetical protein L598_002600000180 [Mesorhizobium sp. J18]
MNFSGDFTAPGDPDVVMRRFTDIGRMARCMPGASLEGKDEEGNYVGVMTVSFGPKRLRFTGRMTCEFDLANRSGVLRGRGSGDARGARVSFETRFRVDPEPVAEGAPPVSRIRIDSTAELGGVIAEFAKTGGIALANVLLRDFATNLEKDLAQDDDAGPISEAKPLSATKVVWSAVKSKFTQN